MATKVGLSLTINLNIGSDLLPAVEPEKDPYIELAEKGLVAVTEALGFFVVNFIPPRKSNGSLLLAYLI